MTDRDKKIRIIVSWMPVLFVMGLIFRFSSQVAYESAQTSFSLLLFIENLLSVTFDHALLRKLAHAFEYFVLSSTIFFAMHISFGRIRPVFTVVLSTFYGITDEIHQIFVPGRACMAFDVFVDMCGATVGVLMCVFLSWLIGVRIKTKNDK